MRFRDPYPFSLVAAGAWLALSPSTGATQTPAVAAEEGQPVAGIGTITRIENLTINDLGIWLAEVDTDLPDRHHDGTIVGPGGSVLQEGMSLSLPAGASLDAFDALTLNTSGASAWNFLLSGTSGTSDDSGVYFGTNLLVQEGATSSAPQFGSGTVYLGFFEVKLNDADQVLVVASVDDPTVPTSLDRAAVLLSVDALGGLAGEAVVVKEGDVLPGQTESVTDVAGGPHAMAVNDLGQVLYCVDLTGPTASNTAIYLDGTLVAQEGSPSPVPGRSWANLAAPELDVNDAGDWVFSGRIDGDTATDRLIERSGAKLVQEGDSLPDIAPFLIEDFGSGPILLSELGDVLWFGDWDNPDTSNDTGLFFNDRLIVEEGVTTVNGVVIDTIRGFEDGYHMSPSGQWILFEAVLVGNVEGTYVVNMGGITEIPGCGTNAGALRHVSGRPTIGRSFVLEVDDAQTLGALPLLAVSNAPVPGFPPCGFMSAFGEVIVGIAPPNPVLLIPGLAWAGSAVPYTIQLGNDPGLVGRSFYNQAIFVDVTGHPEKFRLTGGLRLDIGP